MSDFNNIATFRLADADKINNLPADTNSELAGKADASHTHDDIYYTETETNSLLSGKQSISEKGQPSGYASLDGTGKVPASQLPATVVGGDMSRSTYDVNNNGIVDDTEKLGGELPSYYLDVDNHTDGTTNKVYTTTEKTKLAGIEEGAEVNNISDANATDLTDGGDSTIHYHASDRNRANHTGEQAISTVTNLQTELDKQKGIILSDTDANTITTGGRYGMIGTPTNGAIAGEFALEVFNDGTRAMQIATYLSGVVYTRYYTGSSWSTWVKYDQNASQVGYDNATSGLTANNTQSAIDELGSEKANDNEVVKLSGNQTIAGVKTFSSSPIVPTPTADMEVATKKYVDDNAGGGGGSNPIYQTYIAGELVVGKIARFTVKASQTIAGVKISLGTLPTGADFKVDVRRNGTATTNSIFTSDATIDITTGQSATNGIYTTTKTTIDNGTCAENDVLYVYVSQIGSTLAGTDLEVVIY